VIIGVSSIRAHTHAKGIGFQAYLMQTGVVASQAAGLFGQPITSKGKPGMSRVRSDVDLGPRCMTSAFSPGR
jgi:hypothetical protein